MRLILNLFFIFCLGLNCFSQVYKLNIIGKTSIETKVIDSLGYELSHPNLKSISDERNRISEKLTGIGFLETQTIENSKENEFSYTTKFSLGEKTKYIHIYIGRNEELKNQLDILSKKDTIILPYPETERFLNESIKKLEQNGYALSTLKLINIQKKNKIFYAELQIKTNEKRKLNSIVVQYQESNKNKNFPKGHLKQLNHKYSNRIFNQEIVTQIHDEFEKFGFVNQIKYPEILFTKDSTKIYVYLEKKKSNNFDGFIGFSNSNKKMVLNGYLDITLENTLLAGEQFSIYWKNDSNQQKTFKASLEVPYLFKSPIGIKAQLNIFKQDSIYQNTNTNIDLGYYIDYNTRIYLGYQSTESSDIQNTNSTSIKDYKNSYLTLNTEYLKPNSNDEPLDKNTNLSLTFGFGNRTSNGSSETTNTSKQYFIKIQAMHSFFLNKKNCIYINSQNYYLNSDTYLLNELYNFGGNKSVRGFLENSLQANFMSALITEYRYSLTQNLYIHSILDYCIYKDPTRTAIQNKNENIFSIGLGMGLKTKTGLLKISVANGSAKNNEIKFYNTILNISYNVKF